MRTDVGQKKTRLFQLACITLLFPGHTAFFPLFFHPVFVFQCFFVGFRFFFLHPFFVFFVFLGQARG